jgi:hypothetical protein
MIALTHLYILLNELPSPPHLLPAPEKGVREIERETWEISGA